MARYMKKPVVVEAFQVRDYDRPGFVVPSWFIDALNNDAVLVSRPYDRGGVEFIIKTLEGDMRAYGTDYIIRGVEGELYPCREAIFHRTYEAVSNDQG